MMAILVAFGMLTHMTGCSEQKGASTAPVAHAKAEQATIWRKLIETNESLTDPLTFHANLKKYFAKEGIELRYSQSWVNRVYSVRDTDYEQAVTLIRRSEAPALTKRQPWRLPSDKRTTNLFDLYNIAVVRTPLGKSGSTNLSAPVASQFKDLLKFLESLKVDVRVERPENVEGGFATLNIWIPQDQLTKVQPALLAANKQRPKRWSGVWIHFVADEARFQGDRIHK